MTKVNIHSAVSTPAVAASNKPSTPTVPPKFNFGAVIAQSTSLKADTFSKVPAEESSRYPSVAAAVASLIQQDAKPSTSRFAGQFLAFSGQAKSGSGLSQDQFVQGFDGNTGGGSQQFS